MRYSALTTESQGKLLHSLSEYTELVQRVLSNHCCRPYVQNLCAESIQTIDLFPLADN